MGFGVTEAKSEKGKYLPIGPKVVPFWGSCLEFYKVIFLLWGLWVEPPV